MTLTRGSESAAPSSVGAGTSRAADGYRVAARVSRLLGTPCAALGIISERRVPTGGSALVVSLRTRAGTKVVAKAGPPGLVAAGARAQARAEAAARSSAAQTLRIPRVLAFEPDLAVSEWAPGSPLAECIQRGDVDSVRRVGRALADLTTCGDAGPTRGLADHLGEIVTPVPDLLDRTGLPLPLVRLVQEAIRDVLDAEVAGPAGLVHRDVHPRQLLVHPSGVWLLDWDLASPGDPALDLANLVQHSRARLDAPLARGVIEALHHGYRPTDDVAARLPALEAFTAVRLACKAARLRGAAAQGEVHALLAQARAALARGGHRG